MVRICCTLCAFALLSMLHSAIASGENVGAKLLAEHCLSCHAGLDPKGGLSLVSRELAEQGGESGAALLPSDPLASRLWEVILNDEMPPEKPLDEPQKKQFREWLQEGARWPSHAIDPLQLSTSTRAGTDWWSLQPIRPQVVPIPRKPKPQPNPDMSHAIDAFVEVERAKKGLTQSPAAPRVQWIRRVSLDLTGLPPTPSEIEQYLQDSSPTADEDLVDRYLASPHYGERWARHWMDVVRFGETNGFEYDEPRDHFWHYRNWLIQAFNSDMPYDEFARLQIAGDSAPNPRPDQIAAMGFLVAGPHNTTLPAGNPLVRLAMQQDEIEELVGTVGQTFLGLTVNCARCHDHKFDPISQKSYYEFAANFLGVTHGNQTVTIEFTEQQQRELASLQAELAATDKSIAELRDAAMQEQLSKADGEKATRRSNADVQLPEPLVFWDPTLPLDSSSPNASWDKVGDVQLEKSYASFDGKGGYLKSQNLPKNVRAKTLSAWVQLNTLDQSGGGLLTIQSHDGNQFDSIVFGERDPRQWMAGSNGFVRTRSFQGQAESLAVEQPVHIAIRYDEDGTIHGYRNGVVYGAPHRPGPLVEYSGDAAQILIGLRHTPLGGNRSLNAKVFQVAVFDRALSEPEIEWLARIENQTRVSSLQWMAHLDESTQLQRISLTRYREQLTKRIAEMQDRRKRPIYTHVGGKPGPAKVYRRGEVSSPGEDVSPSPLRSLNSAPESDCFPRESSDQERRKLIADWIVRKDNPLFARVWVNRVWHYHFGTGFIATPNDFGFNGGVPSHPELLELLAEDFVKSGYQVKRLHRQILLSDTYRQDSKGHRAGFDADADNRTYWRYTPHRLDAEEIRDSMLMVASRLSLQVGGIGYRDTKHEFVKGTHIYPSLDESEIPIGRRTVYRFFTRGGRNPLLDTFDCPDPSVATPKRASTTTPLQSLAMMNNALLLSVCDTLASQIQTPSHIGIENEVQSEGKSTASVHPSAQSSISRLYGAILLRAPTELELEEGEDFVSQHGIAPFARVLLNSIEFLYVR